MTNTTTFTVRSSGSETGTARLGQAPSFNAAINESYTYSDGTAAGEADLVFSQSYTIADGGSQAINVNSGLTDPFGAAIAMVKVVAVTVISKSANTTVVTVGAGAAPLPIFAGSSTPLAPGGAFTLSSPDATGIAAVTATTADTLNLVNAAGATADIEVIIAGTSA